VLDLRFNFALQLRPVFLGALVQINGFIQHFGSSRSAAKFNVYVNNLAPFGWPRVLVEGVPHLIEFPV